MQDLQSLVRQPHMDNAAILFAAQAIDETRLLQPIDEAGDAGDYGDSATGDLQDGQRLSLAAKDAKDVVLRRGQVIFPEQAGETDLQLIAGAPDVERGLLRRRLKWPLLFEFVL